ncbi:MAG TPA: CDP-alcohol phosphatidyltransferase family protein [Terracidiphilus sp.]|jgi:phosphatidylglycerophosphate synthase
MNATSARPADENAFANARRINESLTAGYEKRALMWMAERAPHWLTSDQLTALGLISQIGAGVFYGMARYNKYQLIGVIVCIVLNWFGDSMDGTLARVRNQQRPRYGFYVDHMVDVLGATAMMCGLGISGFVHWPVAIAMLVGFLLLAAESYLATYTLACFKMSQGWFGPTEIRILLILGNLALLHSPYATVFGRRFLLFDIGGAIAAALMAVMVVITAARHTIELYRQEPLR